MRMTSEVPTASGWYWAIYKVEDAPQATQGMEAVYLETNLRDVIAYGRAHVVEEFHMWSDVRIQMPVNVIPGGGMARAYFIVDPKI